MKDKLVIIKSDNAFAENLKRYTSKDGILALLLFLVFYFEIFDFGGGSS